MLVKWKLKSESWLSTIDVDLAHSFTKSNKAALTWKERKVDDDDDDDDGSSSKNVYQVFCVR